MKKFITTDKHPFLKEGIEFSYFNTKEIDIQYLSEGFNHITRIPKSNIMVKSWESNGYIKEVEKKEYTNSDMVQYGIHRAEMYTLHPPYNDNEYEILEDYLKDRNNEK